jgi:hypothetical protein
MRFLIGVVCVLLASLVAAPVALVWAIIAWIWWGPWWSLYVVWRVIHFIHIEVACDYFYWELLA